MLIRLTTIVPNTYVCHHQKGGDCWNKIRLYNSSKVLMITKYWKTILLILHFCLLLTTFRNEQRTSRTKRMNE